MKNKILLLIVSVILVLSVAGSIMVFAGSFDKSELADDTNSVTLVEDLKLSTAKSIKRESYERVGAEADKIIEFEGKNVEAVYESSHKDGFGKEYDVYKNDKNNKFTLDTEGNLVGFYKYHDADELLKLDNPNYVFEVTTVKTPDEAAEIAEKYLADTKGIDLSKLELQYSKLMDGMHVYYVCFTTKLGEFYTQDVYYVDISITGEVFSYSHKSEVVPDISKVEPYTFDAVKARAVKDIEEAFGKGYVGCTITDIYAEALEEGDFFKVIAEVEYVPEGTSETLLVGYDIYYEIK